MKAQPVLVVRTLPIAIAAILAGCGGSYGGGGGGGGGGAATLSIAINPTTITLGQSATVTWSSNGNTCAATGAWGGSKSGDGTESVTPATTGPHTYSLVCSGRGYGESDTGSATLQVNPVVVAATFTGEACCAGTETFAVEGIASESGELRFLGRDRHFVGKAGKPAVEFATSESGLAGKLVNDRLAVDPGSIKKHSQPSDSAALVGNFTTHLASGYTLTVSIDADGRLTGIDTRGCRFDGRTSARKPVSQVVDVVLDVSACGVSDGRYQGAAALFAETEDKPARLLLSASNDKSAIGWQLSR